MAHSKHDGNHPHTHGPGCGHPAVRHGDHVDYLHDGHLHHARGEEVLEHVLEVDVEHPGGHIREVACAGPHAHGPKCGHPEVPHGDHVDFLVEGRLHHVHDGHCYDHGALALA